MISFVWEKFVQNSEDCTVDLLLVVTRFYRQIADLPLALSSEFILVSLFSFPGIREWLSSFPGARE